MVHVSGKLGKFTIAWSLWLVERAQALSKNDGKICKNLSYLSKNEGAGPVLCKSSSFHKNLSYWTEKQPEVEHTNIYIT